MKKVLATEVGTTLHATESSLPPRVQEALGELVGAAREGLLALSVGVGLCVVHELMELEVDEVVGAKGKHDPGRVAVRHGHEDGSMTLGGRRVAVSRPRIRTADGERELPVESYEYFADRDPLTRAVMDRMLAGQSLASLPSNPRRGSGGRDGLKPSAQLACVYAGAVPSGPRDRVLRVLRTSDQRLTGVPMRVRAASNPSTSPKTMPNQAWIKQRFINLATRVPGAVFVPSSLADNPHVDYDEYVGRLEHMLPADRERLIHGNWDIMEEGALFHREWFRVVPLSQVEPPVNTVRYWDLAATEPGPSNPDPDYTVGLRLERDRAGTYTVRHIVRGRWAAHEVEAIVKQTAQTDGRNVPVYLEQEPGASGKAAVEYYQRQVLAGYSCHARRSTGDKLVRATPVAAAAGNGLVQIVEGCPHLLEFLDETSAFGEGVRHDDIVDALSGAHLALTHRPQSVMRTFVARGRLPTQHDRFAPGYGI